MKRRLLRQLLILISVCFTLPPAMAVNLNADETAAPASAGSAEGATAGGADDNDIFAASHIASQFEMLSGSRQNAQSLITGLRYSSKVKLAASAQSNAPGSLIFTPPTKPMGYSEISRALSLAQAQLANRGVTSPTPEQLQIALMGGSFVSGEKTVGTTGVLPLRSQGMGWGEIAQALSLSDSDAVQSRAGWAVQPNGDVRPPTNQ